MKRAKPIAAKHAAKVANAVWPVPKPNANAVQPDAQGAHVKGFASHS